VVPAIPFEVQAALGESNHIPHFLIIIRATITHELKHVVVLLIFGGSRDHWVLDLMNLQSDREVLSGVHFA
jgi:hypothetical protein